MIEWVTISNFENYSVSNTGLIQNNITGKILRQTVTKTGYYSVAVKPNGRSGKSKTFRVHREVALAFVPNPDNKPVVNHKNGNKLDNSLSNLEWVTHKENTIHAYDNNLINYKTGYDSPINTLDKELVEQIRLEYVSHSRTHGLRALARKYGIPHNTLSVALNYR